MAKHEKKKYSKSLQEIPIELENDNGEVECYILRELTGPQREEYVDTCTKRVRRNPDGSVRGMDSKGLETLLISMSLYDSSGDNVKVEEMKNWPSSLINGLYDDAARLSGLSKEAVKDAKND